MKPSGKIVVGTSLVVTGLMLYLMALNYAARAHAAAALLDSPDALAQTPDTVLSSIHFDTLLGFAGYGLSIILGVGGLALLLGGIFQKARRRRAPDSSAQSADDLHLP